jgi:HAD superfamily hydrolase (TIGR01509 family)
MNPPAVVVFDLGKVLLDYDYSIASRRILPRTRLTSAEMRRLLGASPLMRQYETGAITTAQFYQEVCAASGYDGGLAEFSAAFGDIFTEIEPMIALRAAVRAAGIPAWIFSNTNELADRHIRSRFPFFSQFDGYVLSYEEGVMKPDPKIYEVVERRTGRRGADILYLDDRPENVAAGLARGWRAFLHETPEKTRALVAELGLPMG